MPALSEFNPVAPETVECPYPFYEAMRDQAPKMFNRLRRTGGLSQHLKEKSAEAHRMYDELAKNLPKLPNGLVRGAQNRQEIEEQVFATLIEFPPDNPKDDQIPGDQTPTFHPEP